MTLLPSLDGCAEGCPAGLPAAMGGTTHFARRSKGQGSAGPVVWGNSPVADSYMSFWDQELKIGAGDVALTEGLRHWVNDGLMALFFVVVGLEIKRELVAGDLRDAPTIAGVALGLVTPVHQVDGAASSHAQAGFAHGEHHLFRSLTAPAMVSACGSGRYVQPSGSSASGRSRSGPAAARCATRRCMRRTRPSSSTDAGRTASARSGGGVAAAAERRDSGCRRDGGELTRDPVAGAGASAATTRPALIATPRQNSDTTTE
jgi:hypothetical protein